MKLSSATAIIFLLLPALSSFSINAKEQSPRCQAAEAQLKRVQGFMKEGNKEKWGRNLADYQAELFKDVDKFCFPDTGVAAQKKSKKVIKKQSQDNGLLTLDANQPWQSLQKEKKAQGPKLAQIGPPGSLDTSRNKKKIPELSSKAKAWKAWYQPAPECVGKLEMNMFVWCNKLEKAQKAEFESLWQKRNAK
ncbi:hypothetical protein HR060_14020 [Catenovulum sp. SM1970]|uniref:hypothetical protein n=1 Tax=Marinifaba aquimaris TaxID=2741323 RepID=UPI001574BB30|nr:hypothetical protein [Marinifaba aquimaris]NTS77971.1 hypothetical protein [Marinifaba aquimaris]